METGSNIVTINDADGNSKNIIDEYERLTFEDINNHAMTYIDQHTRKYQKYVHMYHLI